MRVRSVHSARKPKLWWAFWCYLHIYSAVSASQQSCCSGLLRIQCTHRFLLLFQDFKVVAKLCVELRNLKSRYFSFLTNIDKIDKQWMYIATFYGRKRLGMGLQFYVLIIANMVPKSNKQSCALTEFSFTSEGVDLQTTSIFGDEERGRDF